MGQQMKSHHAEIFRVQRGVTAPLFAHYFALTVFTPVVQFPRSPTKEHNDASLPVGSSPFRVHADLLQTNPEL